MRSLSLVAVVASLAVAAGYGATAGTAPAKLYGTYKVSLTPEDPDVPAAVWTLVLKRGRYTLRNDAYPTIRNGGKLRVKGAVLTFSREKLCPYAVGRYRWRLDGRTLHLTLIGRDSCSGNDRIVVFTSKPWTKQR